MYFRFGDQSVEEEYVPVCPYLQQLYRQFPQPPFPGGMVGPPGFTPPQGPPFYEEETGAPPGFGPPAGPPPDVTPTKAGAEVGVKAVSPATIRNCLFKYTYIWLDNGRAFWVWLTYVDRRSIAGWRWTGRRWVYFGVDIRRIDSFACY